MVLKYIKSCNSLSHGVASGSDIKTSITTSSTYINMARSRALHAKKCDFKVLNFSNGVARTLIKRRLLDQAVI